MGPKRQAFKVSEKVALRKQRAAHPRLSQKELKEWFEATFEKPIAHNTVSEVLSKRYAHLDDALLLHPSKKKQRTENWPVLEQALAEWFVKEQSDLAITGDLIRARAHQLWHSLVQYEGQTEPPWSDGWLSRFCRRHGIKERIRHGEAASVDNGSMAAELVSEVVTYVD